jgi:prophage DNA circulation protein
MNVMKCTRIGEERCNCSCFEIDQEMDAILLIIGNALLNSHGQQLKQSWSTIKQSWSTIKQSWSTIKQSWSTINQ